MLPLLFCLQYCTLNPDGLLNSKPVTGRADRRKPINTEQSSGHAYRRKPIGILTLMANRHCLLDYGTIFIYCI